MNEYLILRLASNSEQSMPWLVWSQQEAEVIASGEIASADQLHELQQKSIGRRVIALAPSIDCLTRQQPLPRKNRRQAIAALPYMLEEEIAQEVDGIHWNCYLQGADSGDLAYVSHHKMALWLGWLEQAQIQVSSLVPEALALPEPAEGECHLAQLNDTWVIRQSSYQTVAIETDEILALWLAAQAEQEVAFTTYTPWPEALTEPEQLETELAELPLAAFVAGAINNRCNLRCGDYKGNSSNQTQPWRAWLKVASLAGIALVLYLAGLGLRMHQLEQQELAVKEQVLAAYKVAFPQAKKPSSAKREMSKALKKIGVVGGMEGSFLEFLHNLRDPYLSIKGIEFESMRFDHHRRELRLQASAPSFQQFEQLKAAIKGAYSAELGAQSSSEGRVSGTITIRRKAS